MKVLILQKIKIKISLNNLHILLINAKLKMMTNNSILMIKLEMSMVIKLIGINMIGQI